MVVTITSKTYQQKTAVSAVFTWQPIIDIIRTDFDDELIEILKEFAP